MLGRAVQVLGSLGLRAKQQVLEPAFQQSKRRMGGGGDNIWYKSYNGKPVPAEYQGPDYVTYGGVTIKKDFHAFDYYFSHLFGAAVTFTMLYHFNINAEEHWYGDIWVFEKDVQTHGWDDEHGHGHGHAHH